MSELDPLGPIESFGSKDQKSSMGSKPVADPLGFRALASSSVIPVPKDEGSGQPLVTVWSLVGHFHLMYEQTCSFKRISWTYTCSFEGHRRSSLPPRLRSSNPERLVPKVGR